MPEFTPLSPAEEDIIVRHGTEPPGTGEYDAFFRDGTYVCRRCNAPLYSSKSKFDAGCGWPSFDTEFPDAVRRLTDPDGRRTEIRCTACDGHLGHVFEGEGLTPKDTRHCVNSLSLRFVPENTPPPSPARMHAYFGGGCFWCTEAAFRMVRGVESVLPGYAGGATDHPTYTSVSSGTTGHAEVVRITFNPDVVSYRDLLTVFFAVHDPTSLNRQGADHGTQYRSIILSADDNQRREATAFIGTLKKSGLRIVTEVIPLTAFHEAEDEHRQYFEQHPEEAYCTTVIDPKLRKLRGALPSLLKKD